MDKGHSQPRPGQILSDWMWLAGREYVEHLAKTCRGQLRASWGLTLCWTLYSFLSTFITPPYTTGYWKWSCSPTFGGANGSWMSTGLTRMPLEGVFVNDRRLEGKTPKIFRLWPLCIWGAGEGLRGWSPSQLQLLHQYENLPCCQSNYEMFLPSFSIFVLFCFVFLPGQMLWVCSRQPCNKLVRVLWIMLM